GDSELDRFTPPTERPFLVIGSRTTDNRGPNDSIPNRIPSRSGDGDAIEAQSGIIIPLGLDCIVDIGARLNHGFDVFAPDYTDRIGVAPGGVGLQMGTLVLGGVGFPVVVINIGIKLVDLPARPTAKHVAVQPDEVIVLLGELPIEDRPRTTGRSAKGALADVARIVEDVEPVIDLNDEPRPAGIMKQLYRLFVRRFDFVTERSTDGFREIRTVEGRGEADGDGLESVSCEECCVVADREDGVFCCDPLRKQSASDEACGV